MADAEKLAETPGTASVETRTSLVEEIAENTIKETLGWTPSDEGYDAVAKGIENLFRMLFSRKEKRADRRFVDQMISQIDKKLSVQLDEILHDPTFQQLESAWRSLKFAVDRINFRENIRVELLNVSKEDLIANLEDAPEVTASGLYKTIYTSEFGIFGGKPVGAMIGNYEFGPGARDIELLRKIASVAAMAHAPFVAAAGPKFFGLDDFRGLENLRDLKALFEGDQYIKWQSFRESEDARYVGLTVPRFLLRLPYDPENNPVRAFEYHETVAGSHEHYLWGNTAFAFATRLADSFARYRWCANIIGPLGGGAVENLPLHQFESMGHLETKIPTEVLIPDHRDFELSEQGFIALTMRKGSDEAVFFSANSVQKPKFFGISAEGKEAETNYKLGTQLPYMFVISRLAHYIKVLQREQIGTWKERTDLQRELDKWIRQYVLDMENPGPTERSRRPLRWAQIEVQDVEGDPGWYRVEIKVRPHFKYSGAYFTLSLVGKLDKR